MRVKRNVTGGRVAGKRTAVWTRARRREGKRGGLGLSQPRETRLWWREGGRRSEGDRAETAAAWQQLWEGTAGKLMEVLPRTTELRKYTAVTILLAALLVLFSTRCDGLAQQPLQGQVGSIRSVTLNLLRSLLIDSD